MKGPCGLVLIAVLWSQAATAAQWNPYTEPTTDFERRLDAAAFGEPGADRAFQDWLSEHPQLPTKQRMLADHQLCNDFNVLGWFGLRVAACTEYVRLKTGRADAIDDHAMAFADQPPPRALGSAIIPLTWNAFGCQSADLTVNGMKSAWFVDTGAEITVVRASLAKQMGIRLLAHKINMGTTTADVSGQVGMIDRLEIGTAVVENVPVIILPDAQLDIANVGRIDGILGLHAFVPFGRMAWIDGGKRLALGEAAPKVRPNAAHIYWQEEGIGVPVRTERGVMGAFLDTGANTTDWRAAGIDLIDPQQLASAKERIRHVGGAGGVVELKERRLQNLRFAVGPLPVRLETVPLSTDKRSAAKIGMDTLSQFRTFILDFEQMRVDGRPKTAAELKTSHGAKRIETRRAPK